MLMMAKRAHPAPKAALKASERRMIEAACRLIVERLPKPTLGVLAEDLGLSPWQLHRLFQRALGISPRAYMDAERARAFLEKLRAGDSIAGAAYEVGYGSSSRIYERAGQRFGMTPASYQKGGQGARITFSIVDSRLGRLLVAATAKGICFLSLGEDDGFLQQELEKEFPKAELLHRDDEANGQAIAELIAYLDGSLPHPDLPLDVQATAFQRRVWQELRAIPPGETRSYQDLAEDLGLPKGQRAVGRACATNPVSLIIPCHRVLRGDGDLGGYRWGLERKSRLLSHEAEQAHKSA